MNLKTWELRLFADSDLLSNLWEIPLRFRTVIPYFQVGTVSLNSLLWFVWALLLSHCWSWDLGQEPWLTVLCLDQRPHVLTTVGSSLFQPSVYALQGMVWGCGLPCCCGGAFLVCFCVIFFFPPLSFGFEILGENTGSNFSYWLSFCHIFMIMFLWLLSCQ